MDTGDEVGVGSKDSIVVDDSVGACDGAFDGNDVGCDEGDVDGILLGLLEGLSDGGDELGPDTTSTLSIHTTPIYSMRRG